MIYCGLLCAISEFKKCEHSESDMLACCRTVCLIASEEIRDRKTSIIWIPRHFINFYTQDSNLAETIRSFTFIPVCLQAGSGRQITSDIKILLISNRQKHFRKDRTKNAFYTSPVSYTLNHNLLNSKL